MVLGEKRSHEEGGGLLNKKEGPVDLLWWVRPQPPCRSTDEGIGQGGNDHSRPVEVRMRGLGKGGMGERVDSKGGRGFGEEGQQGLSCSLGLAEFSASSCSRVGRTGQGQSDRAEPASCELVCCWVMRLQCSRVAVVGQRAGEGHRIGSAGIMCGGVTV